jgi:preprotein translocase subunit SecY
MIIVVRLGVHIPLPGVNVEVLQQWIADQQNTDGGGSMSGLAAVLTIFSGGGLQQLGIFALGIMPYISASIMTQLLTAVVPSWSKMVREEGGRQKVTKWTRGIAIGIAVVQGWFLIQTLENPMRMPFLHGIENFGQLVMFPGPMFALSTILTIVAGTMFLMWIGDQITEKGIGNGVSLIISVNIIHSLPGALTLAWKSLVHPSADQINPTGALALVALIAFLVLVIALVVTVTQAQRRIPVQYAKRLAGNGNKMYQSPTQYLPLKLNYSGVMPVIFATAILSLPQMLIGQIWPTSWLNALVNDWMSQSGLPYYIISAFMIFFFSYFWVATMFQPSQIAEDLKRTGGYIPGVRPGPATALFLDQTMQRLTFTGSLFLTLIYFVPSLLAINGLVHPIVAQFFGGTSLLILVGVLLDMMRQVETTLLQQNYDGFLKKGKIRGRYSHLQGTGSAMNSTKVTIVWVTVAVILLACAIAVYSLS